MPYYVPTIHGADWKSGRLPQTVNYDTVPLGEVAVRRGDPVHATDGEIGRVQGLVIDPGSRHVTHVLLQEGHLWGSKEVAIPIGAVTKVDAGIQLNITMAGEGPVARGPRSPGRVGAPAFGLTGQRHR